MRSSQRARRGAAALLAGATIAVAGGGAALAVAGAAPVSAATATDGASVRLAAAATASEAAALRDRLAAAVRAYDAALRDVGSATSVALGEADGADRAGDAYEQARALRAARIRALYITGPLRAYAEALASADPGQLPARLAYLRGVLAADRETLQSSDEVALSARLRATGAAAAADASRVRAEDVRQRRGALHALVRDAEARRDALLARSRTLDALDRAAALRESREAADLAAAARRAAGAAETARSTQARAGAVPPVYAALYRAAAGTCPGLPWSVLAAIGQVESDHGANAVDSVAGAQGPMQFMPATFASYAVDGNRDGRVDVHDPADAVFSAARYLCASGAGDPATLPRAVWHYNHAQWYVDMVLRIAGDLDPSRGAGRGSPSS